MNILFLCSSNIFRSQMAEAFFNRFSNRHKAQSAALIKPQEKMHKLVVRAMQEEGIDISKNLSKKVTYRMLKESDVIILMNKNLESFLKELKPLLKQNCKIETWNIPDVVARESDEHLYQDFTKARNIIKKKVKRLINRINQDTKR